VSAEKKKEILEALPGKNCGGCGFRTCEEMADAILLDKPELFERCTMLHCSNIPTKSVTEEFEKPTWHDSLGRDYDFILDKFPGDPGPRETILLFNPVNVEKLHLKKGDVIYGRPAWLSCGCPLYHVGVIIEDPDIFNGTVIWCIVGPLWSRKEGINIGFYNSTAYEGMVKDVKPGVELKIGMRYYFQPRYCMTQWRHSGLVNAIGKHGDILRVRIEGLLIG
jgi:uncharacterized Fe-S cluster-containing protein